MADLKNKESFSISLKIGNSHISFLIDLKDTQEQFFQKLSKIYPKCLSKKLETIHKIKIALEQILKKNKLKNQLSETVKCFLEHLTKTQQHEIRHELKNKINIDSNVMQNSDINKELFLKTKSALKQQKKLQKQRLIPKSLPKQKNHSSLKHKNNEDLIKAYETILRKSTNTDMKQMAKESLKQMGYSFGDKNLSEKTKTNYLNQHVAKRDQSSIIDQMVGTTDKKQQSITHQSQQEKGFDEPKIKFNQIKKNYRPVKYKYFDQDSFSLSNTKYESYNASYYDYPYEGPVSKPKKFNYLVD